MALYDEDISSQVPVSNIVDEMFHSGTEPDLISQYLQRFNKDEFKQLRYDSDCIARVFQLDFLNKLSSQNQEWVFNQLKNIPLRSAAYLAWQVCSSKSKASDAMKYKYRKEIGWILSSISTSHPYAHKATWNIDELDDELFFFAHHGSVADAAPNMKVNEFCKIIDHCPERSLFAERMYQLDFFERLEPICMLHMLNSCSQCLMNSKYPIYKFVRQILTSDLTLEIKLSAAMNAKKLLGSYAMQDFVYITSCDQDFAMSLFNSKNFAEMFIRLTAYGERLSSHAIAFLLFAGKTKFLKQWLEMDEESLVASFNIADVIKAL